jgi:hypothetical protein
VKNRGIRQSRSFERGSKNLKNARKSSDAQERKPENSVLWRNGGGKKTKARRHCCLFGGHSLLFCFSIKHPRSLFLSRLFVPTPNQQQQKTAGTPVPNSPPQKGHSQKQTRDLDPRVCVPTNVFLSPARRCSPFLPSPSFSRPSSMPSRLANVMVMVSCSFAACCTLPLHWAASEIATGTHMI